MPIQVEFNLPSARVQIKPTLEDNTSSDSKYLLVAGKDEEREAGKGNSPTQVSSGQKQTHWETMDQNCKKKQRCIGASI